MNSEKNNVFAEYEKEQIEAIMKLNECLNIWYYYGFKSDGEFDFKSYKPEEDLFIKLDERHYMGVRLSEDIFPLPDDELDIVKDKIKKIKEIFSEIKRISEEEIDKFKGQREPKPDEDVMELEELLSSEFEVYEERFCSFKDLINYSNEKIEEKIKKIYKDANFFYCYELPLPKIKDTRKRDYKFLKIIDGYFIKAYWPDRLSNLESVLEFKKSIEEFTDLKKESEDSIKENKKFKKILDSEYARKIITVDLKEPKEFTSLIKNEVKSLGSIEHILNTGEDVLKKEIKNFDWICYEGIFKLEEGKNQCLLELKDGVYCCIGTEGYDYYDCNDDYNGLNELNNSIQMMREILLGKVVDNLKFNKSHNHLLSEFKVITLDEFKEWKVKFNKEEVCISDAKKLQDLFYRNGYEDFIVWYKYQLPGCSSSNTSKNVFIDMGDNKFVEAYNVFKLGGEDEIEEFVSDIKKTKKFFEEESEKSFEYKEYIGYSPKEEFSKNIVIKKDYDAFKNEFVTIGNSYHIRIGDILKQDNMEEYIKDYFRKNVKYFYISQIDSAFHDKTYLVKVRDDCYCKVIFYSKVNGVNESCIKKLKDCFESLEQLPTKSHTSILDYYSSRSITTIESVDEFKKHEICFDGDCFITIGDIMEKKEKDILEDIKKSKENDTWYYCKFPEKENDIMYSEKERLLVRICENYYVEVCYKNNFSDEPDKILEYFEELRTGIISKIEETEKLEGFEKRKKDSLKSLGCDIIDKHDFYEKKGIRLYNIFDYAYTMKQIKEGQYKKSYIDHVKDNYYHQ